MGRQDLGCHDLPHTPEDTKGCQEQLLWTQEGGYTVIPRMLQLVPLLHHLHCETRRQVSARGFAGMRVSERGCKNCGALCVSLHLLQLVAEKVARGAQGRRQDAAVTAQEAVVAPHADML